MIIYLAIDKNDEFELPLFCGNSKEMAQWLGLTIGSFYCAVTRKVAVNYKYLIEKIELKTVKELY